MRMHGWAGKFCDPCILRSMDNRAWAVWQLAYNCMKQEYIPGPAGGGIFNPSISSLEVHAKLKLHGIPEELHADLDDLIMIGFNEYRALREAKRLFFDEHDVAAIRSSDDGAAGV